MNYTLDEQIRLTNLATCSISLRNRYCPICEQLQFKGDALNVEMKCRRCKQILIFQGETVKAYNLKPY